ncbi:hypothetical protein THRCLA_00968 [Thraustotheca clavata]|uniref:Transmembrane protein n=1 Tax=Thraustotheca clavata TaxID=74557 RepID=A0A1W0A9U2_9STRA|nr:hypothetical protein THRCLA_00968 [Thraustotheca clavata]
MDVMVRLAMVLNRMENEDIEVLDRTRLLMVSLLLHSDGYIARTVPDTLNTLMEVITQRISIQRLSAENMRIICFTVLQVMMECTCLLPTDQFVVDLYGCLHSQIWPYTTQLMDPAIVIKEWQISDEEDIQLIHTVMAWKHPTISPLVAQIWSMVYIALIVSGALLALVACLFCDPWHQGFVITGTGLIVLGYHCLSKVSREHNQRQNLINELAKRSTPLLEGHVTIVPPLSPILNESEIVLDEPSAIGSADVDLAEPFGAPLSLAPRSANEEDMATMANIMDQMDPSEMYATLQHLNTLLDEADDVSLETKERVKQGISLLEVMQDQVHQVDS